MDNAEFANATNLKTARNLVRQANRRLSIGDIEEGRAMVRLADEFLARVESPAAEILPFPKIQPMGLER